MKSIKDELEKRLDEVKEERNKLQHRLNSLQEKERAIELLMREEDLLIKPPQLSLPLNENGYKVLGRTPLSQFIFRSLSDGNTKTLKELIEMANREHLSFGGKKPGRVLHQALVGLIKNDYTTVVNRGVWKLTEKALAQYKK
jgi:hypothetical protein